MVTSLESQIAATSSRTEMYRSTARSLLYKASSGGGGMAAISASVDGPRGQGLGDASLNDAVRQYSAAKTGIPFTAIRPIAVKVADQAFRAGTKARVQENSGVDSVRGVKPAGKKTFTDFRLKSAPTFVKRHLADDRQILDTHPVLDSLEDPNQYMTGWALKYCAAFSICSTGRAVLWIDEDPITNRLRTYYIPSHWATPVHEEGRPFAHWKIKPPGVDDANAFPVPATDIAYIPFPDPANPTGSFSSLQSQARPVNTDDEIQKSQFASMKNQGKPGMVLTVGKLPVAPGQAGQIERPTLTPEQRTQLINAVRLAYSGVEAHGEPLILDGLIESAAPYTLSPQDLDFPGGSQLTKDRIMHGIGTPALVAGQSEGANRATAFVLTDIFYSLVVNPVITQISEVLTRWVASRYSSANDTEKIVVWIEKAEAFDADLELSRMQFLADNGWLGGEEARKRLGFEENEEYSGMSKAIPDPVAVAEAKFAAGGSGQKKTLLVT